MKTLLVGYRAADLTDRLLEGDVTCHTLDVYHAHAITHNFPNAKVICAPHLPDGPWDLVRFLTGPKRMAGELALDLLQEIHFLKPKDFVLNYEGRERDRNDLLDKIRDKPDRRRSFAAEWPASVPGGPRLQFVSTPGCFCHRRLDEGGLALAEVVSRELLEGDAPRMRLFDMGCGCGLVGLLIATRLKPRTVDLTMVDSHARAVEAAKANAERFDVAADVVLSDNGLGADANDTFDVFVGNPPYYSDYRIAEVFLESAVRALKPGGVCYTVVKNAAGLKPVQEKFFTAVEVIPRRNYSVLKSVKTITIASKGTIHDQQTRIH